MLHRVVGGACFADPHKNNAPSEEGGCPLAHIEVRKEMGIECWCWAFSRNPKLASAEIFKHGDQTALRRGIDEAINRGDSDSAMRLRTRLLRETPKQERDDLWLHDVDRQLSKLSKAGRKKSRSFNQPR